MHIFSNLVSGLAFTLAVALPQNNQRDENITESPYLVVEDNDHDPTNTMDMGGQSTCVEIMANSGLNFSSFWHGAAHGIHSIYLEEIREYFEPNALTKNKIPVVNKNLTHEETIIFDAPLAGYDEDFKTMAMKVFAYFMLNDSPSLAQQGVNTLEKITHQYHMHEIYKAAIPIYESLKANPPTDPELCACVNDVTSNGILTELVNIAQQLKYFGSKRKPRARAMQGLCSQSYQSYQRYSRGGCRRKRSVKGTVKEYEALYLANSTHENAALLLDVKPWKAGTFKGPEQWVAYEAMLTYSMLEEEELNDFATFMYCKLNQPELDYLGHIFNKA